MNEQQVIWLASWPRSGNTLLRTVLWHCFKLKSASIYPNDLGGNKKLEKNVGHIEYDANRQLKFPKGKPRLVKTHEPPRNNAPAIYVVRDGRAACVSLWNFYEKKPTLEAIIAGEHRFASWANHIQAWDPLNRPNSLLIKYESIIEDRLTVLDNLSEFLQRDIVSKKIPSRDDMASIEGRWVRKKTGWRESMSDSDITLFKKVNGEMMKEMGY